MQIAATTITATLLQRRRRNMLKRLRFWKRRTRNSKPCSRKVNDCSIRSCKRRRRSLRIWVACLSNSGHSSRQRSRIPLCFWKPLTGSQVMIISIIKSKNYSCKRLRNSKGKSIIIERRIDRSEMNYSLNRNEEGRLNGELNTWLKRFKNWKLFNQQFRLSCMIQKLSKQRWLKVSVS
jgi:hypothetical protein